MADLLKQSILEKESTVNINTFKKFLSVKSEDKFMLIMKLYNF